MELADKLAEVRTRLAQAAGRAGRKPEAITLVGVSKTAGRATIEAAFQAGLHHFGENRIPDLEDRFIPLPYPTGAATLHLIGHLQTNKAKRAVALVDFIHSVDSLKLAQAISHYAQELGKIVPILLEVNVSGEATKGGLTPADLTSTIVQILPMPNLELRGLMTMAPYTENQEIIRPVFAELRRLFDQHNPGLTTWRDLSMGMTNDFEIAIEEGATLVRVGRAIFQ